ncbi:MAG: cytochrome B [Bacteroidales bacterium]|nr:cytochrome B [Bacteroidales bacterium]
MSSNYYHYPVWVRLWHLVNAVLCIILIITGLMIFLHNPETGAADVAPGGNGLHNISGIILTVSYLGFFLGNLFTGNGKHYRTRMRGSLRRFLKQVRHYIYGQFRGEEPPFPVDGERKFNPVQKGTYAGVMFLVVPFLIISGALMMHSDPAENLSAGLDFYAVLDTLHILLAIIVTLFLLVHLFISITGRHLMSIISGWSSSGQADR